MRFGILCEGTARPGDTLPTLYREALELVDAAEDHGFDYFGCSEQHFWPPIDGIPPIATIPTPEIIYALGVGRTKRLRFRTAVATLAYHHPLILATRIAMLDIISGGRMEFGTGRGNSTLAADAFGIPVDEMYDRWEESLDVILSAWRSTGEFSWDGRYFQIPPRPIDIKPLQQPHPATFYAAFSPQSHEKAGALGLGLMTATAGVTLDKVVERVGLYRKALETAKPIGNNVNNTVCLTLLGHCAQTEELARQQGTQPFIDYYVSATAVYQEMVGRMRPDVDFSKLRDRYTFDHMTDTGMIIAGTPDTWCEKLTQLESMGFDEVWINFVGIDQEHVLSAIELLGREVLKSFQTPDPVGGNGA